MKIFPAKYLIIILFAFVFQAKGNSEEFMPSDSILIDSVKTHSPKKATWLSAALPGAGQIYNSKYETKKWFTYAKVTAIWGGGAALLYFLKYNNTEYLRYKNAYIYRLDQDPATIDEFSNDPRYTSEVLKNERDSWQKYRDYCGLGFLGLYLLNIVEASVTAHFWDYDISEDLSLSIRPQFLAPTPFYKNCLGIRLSFRL